MLDQKLIDKLETEAKKHDADALVHSTEAARIRRFISESSGASVNGDGSRVSPPIQNSLAHLTQLQACETVLKEGGRMHKNALFQELHSRGVRVKNVNSLGVTLSTHRAKFISRGNGEWEFKK